MGAGTLAGARPLGAGTLAGAGPLGAGRRVAPERQQVLPGGSLEAERRLLPRHRPQILPGGSVASGPPICHGG